MFKLSADGLAKVKSELERYESKYSAIIPALYIAQKENKGWVSPQVVEHLSDIMDIPASRIDEVLKFYTMFNQRPVGKHHIQVCCNVSCAMKEARELTDYICSKLQVKEGDVTADGHFTVTRVECLGSCDTAPVAQIGDRYYENLSTDVVDQLLKELK
ncbi:MAG: NAD(P)H-dependent oxidoreductase subunit E [Bdellovibrionales bacterium CG10_big_fil_rev_8_21_14_0_10_45_34]|nr:MAG: NAD(P)H-dependent oxidoreductase subunit E [Bdellovibrionales bacterium CG10_big_fil_rev_8_21_14_0_10_45_34]